MVDWLVNAPTGLSYGAGTPRDMSSLATSLPALGESFREARMRAPVIDPETGQELQLVDPATGMPNPKAYGIIQQEGMRRGGLPYLQGVMPFLAAPAVSRAIQGVVGRAPSEAPAGTPEPVPAPEASAGAPGRTIVSLVKGYVDSGRIAPGSANETVMALAKRLGAGGTPLSATARLSNDQIEQIGRIVSGAEGPVAQQGATHNPAGVGVANIMGPAAVRGGYQRVAAASPYTPPGNEGETTPGYTSQYEQNNAPAPAQGATGTPGVTGGGEGVQTQTPALASAGIQPRAIPTAAQLPPGVARAYAQAGPAAGRPPPLPPPPPKPSVADITPAGAMRATQQWDDYSKRILAAQPFFSLMGPAGAAQGKAMYDNAVGIAKAYRDFSLEQQKLGPEEQIAKRQGMTVAEWNAHKAAIEKDEAQYEKTSSAALESGQTAAESRHMIQFGKAIVNSPEFHSGVMQPTTTEFKRWLVALGGDPNAAVTPEVFQKLVSNMLTEQIKALGNAGVGRVLMTEVQNMQKGIASGTITPASNLLLLELLNRTYQRQSAIAGMVKDIPIKPGQRNVLLKDKIRQYEESTPFFSDDELKDMRLISPPTIRGPQDIASWKIKKGENTPVIWGGAPYREPSGKLVSTGDIVRVR